MFAVIIAIVVAIIVISNINVEIVSNNNVVSNKEIVMTSSKSISEIAAVYVQWMSVDTSVEIEVNVHQYDVECECVECANTSKEKAMGNATFIGSFEGFNVAARLINSNNNEATLKVYMTSMNNTYMRVRTVTVVMIDGNDTPKNALIRLLTK